MSKGWGKPNERKRRRTGEGETSDNSDDGISEILAAHGERFLRSFEDGPESGDTSEGDEPVKKQRKNGGNSGFSTNQATGAEVNTIDEWFSLVAGNNSAFPSNFVKPNTQSNNKVVVVDATKYSDNSLSRPQSEKKIAIVSNRGEGSKPAPGRRKNQESFKERLAREVEELGAQMLTGREKKEYEAKRIMRLGGKAPKNSKVPLKILMGMRKKEAERARKKQEEAIQSGMHVKKKKERSRPGKGHKGLDLYSHAGSFKGGVLRIKPSLLNSGNKSKR